MSAHPARVSWPFPLPAGTPVNARRVMQALMKSHEPQLRSDVMSASGVKSLFIGRVAQADLAICFHSHVERFIRPYVARWGYVVKVTPYGDDAVVSLELAS